MFQHGPLRASRKVMAMLVLATYVFAGALHGICELDVTNPSGTAISFLADNGVDHPDRGVVADHHCHGCFSVAIPAPIVIAAVGEMSVRTVPHHETVRHSMPYGIDPPPPKFLT
jgi:hypothetical protein